MGDGYSFTLSPEAHISGVTVCIDLPDPESVNWDFRARKSKFSLYKISCALFMKWKSRVFVGCTEPKNKQIFGVELIFAFSYRLVGFGGHHFAWFRVQAFEPQHPSLCHSVRDFIFIVFFFLLAQGLHQLDRRIGSHLLPSRVSFFFSHVSLIVLFVFFFYMCSVSPLKKKLTRALVLLKTGTPFPSSKLGLVRKRALWSFAWWCFCFY